MSQLPNSNVIVAVIMLSDFNKSISHYNDFEYTMSSDFALSNTNSVYIFHYFYDDVISFSVSGIGTTDDHGVYCIYMSHIDVHLANCMGQYNKFI